MSKYLGILAFICMSFSTQAPSFKDMQLNYSRVFQAFRDKGELALAKLAEAGINHFDFDIYLRAFKFEEDLEVWAKNRNDSTYTLVQTYKFCSNVGTLGPKRKEGDKQIPEGIYKISQFNYASEFCLSLKVNYPNASDIVFADAQSPGGMIYIHGGCNTVGCIPITDEGIKELYVLCVEAKNSGQEEIPVHILPARLTAENFDLIKKQYGSSQLTAFWKQLKSGFDIFERTKKLPRTVISSRGDYFFFEK
jgi:murein L,D-transpeptidase YafK